MTAKRALHLIAYDVGDAKRLSKMLHMIKEHATGGQKSVFECYLTKQERKFLLQDIASILDHEEDKFFLLRLDPRGFVQGMGCAILPEDPAFYYVG